MVLVAKRDYKWLEPQTWEMIGGKGQVSLSLQYVLWKLW